ncbi:MAG: hypothetical protein JNL34_16795 [Anaerolineae bacterium]|nr:hypothetical protein [Anaerolineae bacterium]
MAVTVSWDEEEPNVLRLAFGGQWTWDELYEATRRITAMCAARPGRVDLISDMFEAPYRPGQFEDHLNRLIAGYKRSDNLRRVVLTMSGFHYQLYLAFASQNPRTLAYDVAPDVNAARELIRAARLDLPLPEYVPAVEMLV